MNGNNGWTSFKNFKKKIFNFSKCKINRFGRFVKYLFYRVLSETTKGDQMSRMGKAGVAAAVVLVIMAASIGGAMATPLIADAIGAPPDSPLYGLKRLGEKMRLASDEEQMQRRWEEYSQMVNRGKGLEYVALLEEFREKVKMVAPADVEAKTGAVQWLQTQMPGIGLVELKLAQECTIRSRKYVENHPGFPEGLENIIRILQDLEQQYQNGTDESRENILAQLRLVMEQLRMMIAQLRGQLPGELGRYFDIDNLLTDTRIDLGLHIGGGFGPPIDNRWPHPENAAESFSEWLEKFNARVAEVQEKLEEVPENTPGREMAESQLQMAIQLRDDAIAENSAGNLTKALFTLRAAFARLDCAGRILEQATEWLPGLLPRLGPWANFPSRKIPAGPPMGPWSW